MMNIPLLVAALLLLAGAIVHILIAGSGVHRKMQAVLEGRLALLERVTWHAVSVWIVLHLLLACVGLVWPDPSLMGVFLFAALHAAALGFMCLFFSLRQRRSWIAMPQAYLFFLIAVAFGGAAMTSA